MPIHSASEDYFEISADTAKTLLVIVGKKRFVFPWTGLVAVMMPSSSEGVIQFSAAEIEFQIGEQAEEDVPDFLGQFLEGVRQMSMTVLMQHKDFRVKVIQKQEDGEKQEV